MARTRKAIQWTPEMDAKLAKMWSSDYTVDEIAEALGVSTTTAMARGKDIGLGYKDASDSRFTLFNPVLIEDRPDTRDLTQRLCGDPTDAQRAAMKIWADTKKPPVVEGEK